MMIKIVNWVQRKDLFSVAANDYLIKSEAH